MDRVLITGAAGAIGGVLRAGLAGCYGALRLSDIAPLGEARPGEELAPADVCDFAAVAAATAGVDAVVHLGGHATEADWPTIHEKNVVGTYHVFEAARRAGARRIVFASSNHAVGFYRRSVRTGPDAPLRPDSLYGVSKAFGEALGRYYADNFGLGVVALRIGTFAARPPDRRALSTWISHRDMVALTVAALEAYIHFEIVYGISANDRAWWDNPGAQRIGYRPRDNAEAFAAEILAAPEADEPEASRLFHGGAIAAAGFAGDVTEID